jgi:two-component system response regulator FixJ
MTTDRTIFVVDDDPAVGDALSVLLEVMGYRVETFASGQAFLDAFEPSRGGCVVLDVSMPGIDGLEVQRRLRAAGHTLPVVFMTAHADVPIAIRAMKEGAADFIEKPFDDSQIGAAIAGALAASEQQQQMSDDVAAARQRVDRLTPREREVLEHLVAGRPNKVIAHELDMSPRTVEKHRARVMEKLASRSLSQVVRMALAAGIDGPSR